MNLDLPLIWAGLIAFAVLAYVVLDGFDLGVGILFLFVKGESSRDQMMNTVAPVWDGNETWLVLGGRRLVCRLSAGLCGDHAGTICADYGNVTGVGISWRRV